MSILENITDLPILIETLYPNARRRKNEWRVGSIAGEEGDSCVIDKHGRAYDFNGGHTFDMVDSLMQLEVLDYSGAVNWLKRHGFYNNTNPNQELLEKRKEMQRQMKVEVEELKRLIPAPKVPPKITKRKILRDLEWIERKLPLHKKQVPTGNIVVYPYYNKNGRIVIVQARIETKDGKTYIRYTWDPAWNKGAGGWKIGGTKDRTGFPLFNQSSITDSKTILIVEGEKTVRSAERIFDGFSVISPLQNSRTDWSVVLPHKNRVVILPDYDDGGWSRALEICNALEIQANDHVLNPVDVAHSLGIKTMIPKGWDVADISRDVKWTGLKKNSWAVRFSREIAERIDRSILYRGWAEFAEKQDYIFIEQTGLFSWRTINICCLHQNSNEPVTDDMVYSFLENEATLTLNFDANNDFENLDIITACPSCDSSASYYGLLCSAFRIHEDGLLPIEFFDGSVTEEDIGKPLI